MDYRTAGMADTLVEIEALLADGKLSRREGFYAAAALAWYEGNYLKSGMLLETSLVNTRADLVAVRLAQDAYIAAGSSHNVLNSVVRHPSTSETPGHLQGHLLGMIAKGYVETGQLKQAEDESERAVEATKGQSSLALHTLLNCYQIQGRSSEINAKLEEFISKHEGNGLANLLYSRGSAHILRGNYSGAYKVVEELVELLEGQYKLGDDSHSSVVWSHAVLLLWNLCLNTSDLNDVVFTAEEARTHHATLIGEVVRMLCAGVVHGDLSEFNILLAHSGEDDGVDFPVIIDLPQAVDAAGNLHAQRMLLRDVANLRDFFGQFAPELQKTQFGPEIWSLYQSGRLSNETPLTGRYERAPGTVDLGSVMREIDDARDEDAARRLRMAQT